MKDFVDYYSNGLHTMNSLICDMKYLTVTTYYLDVSAFLLSILHFT